MNLYRIAKLALLSLVIAFGARTASAQDQYIGEIRIVGFNFAPVGWALCQGQLMAINENTALFSLLGTQYGGNGTTTFGLPNLQGRFPLGAGYGAGLTPRNNGDTGGAETYTLTVAQLPAHSHPLMASSVEASATSPEGNVLGTKARVPLFVTGTPDMMMSSESIGSTGQNQPYSVMPPYTGVTYIIALEGIYPARS